MIKGIIWCNNIENGLRKLDSIIKDYRYFSDVDWNEYRRNSRTVIFKNGDIWKVLTDKYNGYGERCNISYIDHNINKGYIDSVIMPATISLPFNGVWYY